VNRRELRRLSRTIAHALRHQPWLYELEVDEDGWVPLPQLLDALRRRRSSWHDLSRADIDRMIAASDKRRYELRGDRIRALYGHSLAGRLRKRPVEPPAVLFHGTAPAARARIMETGLLPMQRQYVHLSATRATALEVGARKARNPLVLTVDAARAHRDGITFYLGNELVWLADRVPPRYLSSD